MAKEKPEVDKVDFGLIKSQKNKMQKYSLLCLLKKVFDLNISHKNCISTFYFYGTLMYCIYFLVS